MIIRRRVTRNFTILSNELFEDGRLSLEALGLLAWLRSRPDNWQLSVEHLRRRFKVGRNKIHNLIRELVETGWVTRERRRNAVTKAFVGIEYVVLDEASSTTVEDQTPGPENGDVARGQPKEPRPDLPDVALPEAANQDEIIRTESKQERHTPLPPSLPVAQGLCGSLHEQEQSIAGESASLTAGWSDLARLWPWEPGESRTQPEERFATLDQTTRLHVLVAAPAYLRDRERADRRRCHLKTFIEQRLYLEYAAQPALAPVQTAKVFVAVGTDEFAAWDRAYRAAGKLGMPCHSRHVGRDGWWCPSDWPPADWRPGAAT